MRDLKGDWRDLFNGFMLALDLRKMFLAFCGIVFTVFGIGAVTAIIGNTIDPEFVHRPNGFHLHTMYQTVAQSWHVIFSGTDGHPADWKIYLPYSVFAVLAFLVIWSYFGGAISRIAAYEIAKDGERIETAKALRFASKKFWSFFWAPLICAIGFGFFFLCNFVGGLIGKALDVIPYAGVVGAPLVAILLPLAILSGFIMTLILLGTLAGSSLFAPAVAAEGTDSFDAVSRGFSYVYSRPWHYLWYQGVSAVYGYVCIAFVILFAVTMCHIGLKAGGAGFDLFGFWHRDQYDHIADASWGMILSKEHQQRRYNWDPVTYGRNLPMRLARTPCDPLIREPYGRLQHLSARIVRPDWRCTMDNVGEFSPVSTESRRKAFDRRWDDLEKTWRSEKDKGKQAELQKKKLNELFALAMEAPELNPTVAEKAATIVYLHDPSKRKDLEASLKKVKESKTVKGEEEKSTPPAVNPAGHKVAAYIVTAWLIVILGLALGYPIAYFFSQQTMIYYILRKKVDGIEMNEVFEETEEEEKMPEPIAPPKSVEPPTGSPPVAPPSEGKQPEPPKS